MIAAWYYIIPDLPSQLDERGETLGENMLAPIAECAQAQEGPQTQRHVGEPEQARGDSTPNFATESTS